MRGFLTLLSVFALASTSVFASPVAPCVDELCNGKGFPDSSPGLTDIAASLPTIDTRSISGHDPEQLTNAERLARGLPLKKPKLVQGSPLRRTQASPVPCITHKGHIRIDRVDNGSTLGYLSSETLNGAYTKYDGNFDKAAIVSFKTEPGHTSGSVSDFTFEPDSLGGFHAFGLVQGRDDTNSNIASGSFHYLYISGTTKTAPGATPQTVPNSYTAATGMSRTAESEVWSWDSVTQALTLQWVNTDGSKPATQIWTQSTALYAGADPDAFSTKYPSPVTRLTFTFVPI